MVGNHLGVDLMTLYLLDTNVLSNLSKPRPIQSVVDWCHQLHPRNWCIAQCTVIEIRRGIKLLRAKDEKRAAAVDEWFENFLTMKPRIIPEDFNIIEIFTDLSVIPDLQNLFAPFPGRFPARVGRDLEIAATAIAMRATIVTLNVKDFLQINAHLRLPGLLNPDTGEWVVRPARRQSAKLGNVDAHWDSHRRLSSKTSKV
jgi:predicted nucleic acid-binding protein